MIYNEGQKIGLKKLDNFIASHRKTFVLTGKAGTGKTTILKQIRNKYPQIKLYGATISHQAKSILSRSIGKYNCFTVASLLGIKLNEETGEFKKDLFTVPQIKNFKGGGLLIIDECSMINQKLMDEILCEAQHNLKIIFVGDIKQIPPIGEEDKLSPTFNEYSDDNDFHQLTQIMRYDDEIAILGEAIINGIDTNTITNINRKTSNNIHYYSDLETTINSFVEDYKLQPLQTKSITYNNHKNSNPLSVYNINKQIRNKLFPDATSNIVVGELFTFYAPFMDKDGDDNEVLAQNSESFTVLEFKQETMNLNVSCFSKKLGNRSFKNTYEKSYLSKVKFEDGRIIDDLHLVLDPKLKKDLELYSKSGDWQMYYTILKEIPFIQYGYCLTVHKCQGSGYQNVYVFEDNIMNSPQTISNKYRTLYTAITRSTKKLVINSFNN